MTIQLKPEFLSALPEKIKCMETKVNHSDVYDFYLKLIPHVHYQLYYLVDKPNKDITFGDCTVFDAFTNKALDIHYLTHEDINKLIPDVQIETIDVYMEVLTGIGAVLSQTVYGTTKYLIDPRIIIGATDEKSDKYTHFVVCMCSQFD
ncbi:hypothetical protein [Bacillus massiliigorillae]|uniref:hypothetical protein n=1 Tax=Bacillus massiliigorillae TaxID=1243664 RepID=UPI000399E385|nr:hypothetical protein [Bacillus massiliigorillae]